MGGRPSINLLSRFARLAVYSLTSELKKMAITVIRRRIAEFLTNIERKKCNTTQNIVIDGCCLLFEEYLQKKNRSIYILNPCREIGLSFEKSLRGGKLVKNFEIFWMSNKTIIAFGFRVMWRIMQWSWRLLSTLVFSSVDNSRLLDLLNSSHHTQPRSIQSNPALRTAAYHGQFPLCPGKAVTFSLNPTHLIRTPVNGDNGRLFLAQSTDSHRQSTSLMRTLHYQLCVDMICI